MIPICIIMRLEGPQMYSKRIRMLFESYRVKCQAQYNAPRKRRTETDAEYLFDRIEEWNLDSNNNNK